MLYTGNKKTIRFFSRTAFRFATFFPLALRNYGGDGGNRTRVRNIRPETSSSIVDLYKIRRRSSDQHEALR